MYRWEYRRSLLDVPLGVPKELARCTVKSSFSEFRKQSLVRWRYFYFETTKRKFVLMSDIQMRICSFIQWWQ
jgi:hypothetical protein